MSVSDLERILNEYNWDDGFKIPRKLLGNPDCDLALALEIFYLADGYAYFEGLAENTWRKEWKQFICSLYNDILDGKYMKSARRFEIPLTGVQKYKLQKRQIPEVFLTDL